MRKNITYAAAMLCALGMAGESVAAENSAPLTRNVATHQHTLGICQVVGSGKMGLSPVVLANSYFKMDGNSVDFINYATAKVTIIQQPVHGSLWPDSRDDWRGASYVAPDDYLGNDSFVLEVEGSGYKVKLRYFMDVTDIVGGVSNPNPVCKGEHGRSYWKIFQEADGNGTLTGH